jgi:ABC-type branched-subunit amino acid transport system ATPase component
LGIGRTFQVTRLFGQMTALENMLVVGRHADGTDRARATDLLEFVHLQDARNEYAANLSYGQQKLLEFARLLMVDPSLILLDEPFAGVNPTMAERLRERLQVLVEHGKTLLVTDHEMRTMMAICAEIFVLDYGELIAHGTPEAIRSDPRVIEAYFGH